MKRRLFVTGVLGSGFAASVAYANSKALLVPKKPIAFRVMRHGSDIGRHDVTFEQSGNRLIVHIEATMRIGFGPITFYRYHHQATEIWENNCFSSFDSKTDKNGTNIMVKARRANGVVTIETGKAPLLTLPPDIIPFTHWNQAVTRSPLFNPQEGVAVTEKVTRFPIGPVKLADGHEIPATRFDFSGTATITDWYDENGLWAALRAVAPDGSVLQYERLG